MNAPIRRMVVVPLDEAIEIGRLARAAIKLHENVTHYGKCEICDLADKWRARLRDDDLDVNGIKEWRELRKASR